MPNKYKNVEQIVDGIKFQSRREATRYAELKLLARSGLIQNLRLQVPFELIPKQQGERSVKYIADFVYTENGETVAEDTKSEITRANPTYILKRKLLLWVHGLRIKEV